MGLLKRKTKGADEAPAKPARARKSDTKPARKSKPNPPVAPVLDPAPELTMPARPQWPSHDEEW